MIIDGLTIDDFEGLPDVLAHYHELVDGKLVDVSGNIGTHNRLRDTLSLLIGPYVQHHNLGLVISEQDFEFGENAHGPDVSFMSPAKLKAFAGHLRACTGSCPIWRSRSLRRTTPLTAC